MKFELAKKEALEVFRLERVPLAIVKDGLHVEYSDGPEASDSFGYCPLAAVAILYPYNGGIAEVIT